MAIHWQIPFRSLRSGTDYVVNVYDADYSGSPVILYGGAQPFETQEDDDDDLFTVTRLQSGYIRIVDNGYAADGTTAFDWKAFAPATDFARPVTLTHGSTVDWQGYLQAQNFSGGLYGNPQDREFPVQCILTVLGAKDVDYTQTNVQNFAYLISQVFASIGITTSSSPIGIRYFYFQGGEFARCWLLKLIDWQNFVSDDGEQTLSARFDMLTILEDVCRFWGWTARTCGRDVFFTMADDQAGAPGFLKLTLAELQSIAGGDTSTSIGTAETFDAVTLTGEIFASTANDDMKMRGASVAKVTADPGNADETWFTAYPEYIKKEMFNGGWGEVIRYHGWQGGHGGEWKDVWTKYTTGKTSVSTPTFNITSGDGATLNLGQYSETESDVRYGSNTNYVCVMRMTTVYNGTPKIQLESVYSHIFDGDFSIEGDVRFYGYALKEDNALDNHYIVIRFGIGETRATAQWYNGNFGWSSTATEFYARVNYTDGVWRFGDMMYPTIYVPTNAYGKKGKVFIDIMGGSPSEWDFDTSTATRMPLDIEGFTLKYNRFGIDITTLSTTEPLKDRKEYKAKNNNMSRQEWTADVIYASGVDMSYAFGLVFNPANLRPLSNAEYMSGDEPPEQHLADRVAAYWAASRRMITTEMRTETVGSITPDQMVTIDGTTCHPISIGHQWRDDITNVSFLEIP